MNSLAVHQSQKPRTPKALGSLRTCMRLLLAKRCCTPFNPSVRSSDGDVSQVSWFRDLWNWRVRTYRLVMSGTSATPVQTDRKQPLVISLYCWTCPTGMYCTECYSSRQLWLLVLAIHIILVVTTCEVCNHAATMLAHLFSDHSVFSELIQ